MESGLDVLLLLLGLFTQDERTRHSRRRHAAAWRHLRLISQAMVSVITLQEGVRRRTQKSKSPPLSSTAMCSTTSIARDNLVHAAAKSNFQVRMFCLFRFRFVSKLTIMRATSPIIGCVVGPCCASSVPTPSCAAAVDEPGGWHPSLSAAVGDWSAVFFPWLISSPSSPGRDHETPLSHSLFRQENAETMLPG